MKLIHIHQPKTAGTSLRESIKAACPELTICPARYPADLRKETDTYDVYSGHFSLDDTKHIEGQYFTIFRDPVDRFISVYYFWRQLYEKGIEQTKKTKLASKYNLEEFAKIFDEPELIQEFFNRITWQIAYSFELQKRFEYRFRTAHTDQQLLKEAVQNLDKFIVIGFQEAYPEFLAVLNNKLSRNVLNKQINVTRERRTKEEISAQIHKQIEKWVYLDIELFEATKKHPSSVGHE